MNEQQGVHAMRQNTGRQQNTYRRYMPYEVAANGLQSYPVLPCQDSTSQQFQVGGNRPSRPVTNHFNNQMASSATYNKNPMQAIPHSHNAVNRLLYSYPQNTSYRDSNTKTNSSVPLQNLPIDYVPVSAMIQNFSEPDGSVMGQNMSGIFMRQRMTPSFQDSGAADISAMNGGQSYSNYSLHTNTNVPNASAVTRPSDASEACSGEASPRSLYIYPLMPSPRVGYSLFVPFPMRINNCTFFNFPPFDWQKRFHQVVPIQQHRPSLRQVAEQVPCFSYGYPEGTIAEMSETAWEVSCNAIRVRLRNTDLWESLVQLYIEMVIDKRGKLLFPRLEYDVTGLDPEKRYNVSVDFVLVNENKWTFSDHQWICSGKAPEDHMHSNKDRVYYHPDSPALGDVWNRNGIKFSELRMSNNIEHADGKVHLMSMCRYVPRLYICEVDPDHPAENAGMRIFVLPNTEFVAVTSYKNTDLSRAKTNLNPYCRGRIGNRKRSANYQQENNEDQANGTSIQDQILDPIPNLQVLTPPSSGPCLIHLGSIKELILESPTLPGSESCQFPSPSRQILSHDIEYASEVQTPNT